MFLCRVFIHIDGWCVSLLCCLCVCVFMLTFEIGKLYDLVLRLSLPFSVSLYVVLFVCVCVCLLTIEKEKKEIFCHAHV
jgi:hypothetical protein